MTITSKVNSVYSKKDSTSSNNDGRSKPEVFCLACQDGATNMNVAKHETANCDHWFNLTFAQRRKLVKCEHHPRSSSSVTSQCKFKKPRVPCKFCKAADHHSLFCPVHRSTSNLTTSSTLYVSELPH